MILLELFSILNSLRFLSKNLRFKKQFCFLYSFKRKTCYKTWLKGIKLRCIQTSFNEFSVFILRIGPRMMTIEKRGLQNILSPAVSRCLPLSTPSVFQIYSTPSIKRSSSYTLPIKFPHLLVLVPFSPISITNKSLDLEFSCLMRQFYVLSW